MSQKGMGIISDLISLTGLGKKRKRRTRRTRVQNGAGFFSDAWSKLKSSGLLSKANDYAKSSKIVSNLVSKIPVIGKVAGDFVRSTGYGKKKKRSGRGKKVIGL